MPRLGLHTTDKFGSSVEPFVKIECSGEEFDLDNLVVVVAALVLILSWVLFFSLDAFRRGSALLVDNSIQIILRCFLSTTERSCFSRRNRFVVVVVGS